jgi:phenylalanyl-tRNA synthetase alpha chain
MRSMEKTKKLLMERVRTLEAPRDIFKAGELRELYGEIVKQPVEGRAEFGRAVNELKGELEREVTRLEAEIESATVEGLDISAPCGVNSELPEFLAAGTGSRHPLMSELARVVEIYQKMGFEAVESRQLDDDYHMFESLNFPVGHPARDGFDTFYTEEGFIPPAHTSTMQNRILRAGRAKLEAGGQIAAVSYGRVFRNEDQDATHEHTLYQCEGVFVSESANLGQMMALLREFFENYYGQKLEIRTQPAYFPFTEPSLEFLIKKPTGMGGKGDGWLEMLGCGMIHPNVLAAAGIDATKYRGFAWGGGIDRLAMLKYGLADIRHFEAGRLQFLREFR